MPEGLSLCDVVEKNLLPLPPGAEAVAMKLISGADCLQSREAKAVKDFDDALALFSKMWHEDEEMTYKNEAEKMLVKIAFNKFYPTYESFKKERGDSPTSEADFKFFLKID